MSRIPIDDDNDTQEDQGSSLEGEAMEPPGAAGDDSDKLKTERDSLYERLARTTAEFQNSRKRLQAEADQRAQYANSALIKSLLPVIDNFERALAQDPSKTDAATLLKGMQIVHDQWLNVLKQQQVEEIAPQPGDPFDPTRHEALMQAPSEFPPGSVVQMLQKGYALHDRTLRPAQVSVSKGQ
ncbi:MAG TPA: nucleotide exchange factor GrpE [Tepidisphaeraceae bacterium]|nr:nucleotide exchange factor GrpE [Tepidisphaeraceae bacterium]